jgi:hypothetical protein
MHKMLLYLWWALVGEMIPLMIAISVQPLVASIGESEFASAPVP